MKYPMETVTCGSQGAVTVGTVTCVVATENENRLSLVMTNIGSNSISVALGTNGATAGEGVVLTQYAPRYVLDVNNPWQGEVQAIAAQAAQSLAVSETTKE